MKIRCTRQEIVAPLLAWFDVHKRDFPWRQTRDPYRIWVSEIMSQQTQIDRVTGYYECFLAVFPTVHALAEAELDDVLALWEGLGYYSRARNLHAAARMVVEQHGGEFPRTPQAMRALPGVGEYTTGAVLSIAFGMPAPAVDVNVTRVIARLYAVEGDVSAGEVRRRIVECATKIMPDERPGDFNQALIELGALLCTPGRPGCLICPLQKICEAKLRGLQDVIPPPKSRPMNNVASVAGVVRDDDGRVLVARRPVDGQWGGLWEFPNVRTGPDEAPHSALCGYLSEAFGIEVAVTGEVAAFTYGLMNCRVALTVLSCMIEGGIPTVREHDEAQWLHVEELAEIALPSPHRTIVEMLRADGV